MPSESSFKKQVESIRESLKNFLVVRTFKNPVLVKAAINDLIDTTVVLNHFTTYFLSHDLFQELPPAVFSALADFSAENPDFIMPKAMDKISALNDRVSGSFANVISQKSSYLPLFFLLLLHLLVNSSFLPAIVPSAPRADSKPKKSKVPSVR